MGDNFAWRDPNSGLAAGLGDVRKGDVHSASRSVLAPVHALTERRARKDDHVFGKRRGFWRVVGKEEVIQSANSLAFLSVGVTSL
jgi:hypothetical protein